MWYHDDQPFDEKHEGFIEYVLEFYGKDGIYPMNANVNHVIEALEELLGREGSDNMNTRNEILEIETSLAHYINELLTQTESSDVTDEVVFGFTKKVKDTPFEIDINVVGCDGSYYIDAILFENGHEVMCLEPQYDRIDGNYIFEIGQDLISLTIETVNH